MTTLPDHIKPGEISVGDPAYYIQRRPDSDIKHPSMRLSLAFREAWVKGNDSNGEDMVRLYALMQNLYELESRGVPGAIAELGVYRGNSAWVLHHGAPDRRLYLFDTFKGFDSRDTNHIPALGKPAHFSNTSLELVQRFVGTDENVRYCAGWFPETANQVPADERFAAVHIDMDLEQPIRAALDYFYPRLNPGGIIILHDYRNGYWGDAAFHVSQKFMADKPENFIPMPDRSGTAIMVKNKTVPCPMPGIAPP